MGRPARTATLLKQELELRLLGQAIFMAGGVETACFSWSWAFFRDSPAQDDAVWARR